MGRHRRQGATPRQTIQVVQAATGQFVAVTGADSLDDRETLRVAIDGRVATIVNLDGQIYAFQEFCTHRCGPLSEGSFYIGQAEYPWQGITGIGSAALEIAMTSDALMHADRGVRRRLEAR